MEECVAHLTRAVDDLSDVVARQARELDILDLAERAGFGVDANMASAKAKDFFKRK